MITAQAFAVCIFAAAQTYVVPPSVIIGILNVEGGKVGQAVRNSNNTYDLGPMQINTLWIPELARYWGVSKSVATYRVRNDACVNIGVGAWILRKKINQTGSLSKGIAYYHSGTPRLGHKYRKKVINAMRKYRLMRNKDKRIASIIRTHNPG
ncbi:MAG: lytic transglycosylase domain-containing protein [Alphaproteobacteria bacterium]|nr:lytic transglycosylase domain-containing protein [Alphaproteobacteria bacterium]MCK5518018.1 lytic transglycosylase domain-containing protein [Alphaproteobacteria bacterium]MCK5658355.1 lytic transglycosylase domain-containing protein [Alphaproteobacteria bacterium]